jgi:serine/threonine protein kinase
MSPVADCDLKAFYSLCKGDEGRMDTLRTFYGCLAAALDYLHTSKIRHRDIKPQNILVKGVTVYLTDFGISLDWEGLSRSTTTEDSAKTVLYCAPEVAGYKPRNTASDVWSLGCVFLEIATVLAGLEVEEMQQFFRTTNGDYRFYTNIGIIPNWSSFIAPKLPQGDDAPLEWVSEMLLLDPSERPSTTYLVNSIAQNARAHHPSTTRFCGSCCEAEISSDGSGSDGELWADNYETVKPRKDPEIESLSKLVKQQQLSSPPARNPPPYPSIYPFTTNDLPTRRDIPLAGGIGNVTKQSIWDKAADDNLSRAIKFSREEPLMLDKFYDDDLAIAEAIKLSREEELRRRKIEPNASVFFNPLFDDDPIQVPEYAGFNQEYQQLDNSPPKLSFIALKNLLSANEQDHAKREGSTSSLGLSPEEKRVYGKLFREADLDKIGVVKGKDAVKLFEKTGLEPWILGNVCSVISLCRRRTRLIILDRYGRL